MEQNNRKNLKKYLDLVAYGDQILKKTGWNQDGNNMYKQSSPSKEEYSGYLNSCMSLIVDSLGDKSPSYLIIKKLIDNEKTLKNPYYFAECYGIVKAAYEIYNEKILSENKLDILIDKIEKLLNTTFKYNNTFDTGFKIWHKDFKSVFETYEFVNDSWETTFNNLKFNNFDMGISILKAILEQIKEDINIYGEQAVKIKEQKKLKEISSIAYNKQVFIVHGHNKEKKVTTARLIEKLKLIPIILHEQPNKGMTIKEKLSKYSDAVGFAIILLTADDLGKCKDESNLKSRARQNVIFELGYFLAKLGDKNVCALCENGVEIPTDYSGVIYIEFDAKESWKLELAKELKAAGYDIDMNNI